MVEMRAAVGSDQAAGADHEQRTFHAGTTHGVEYIPDVGFVPLNRSDDDGVAGENGSEVRDVCRARLPYGHAGAWLHLGGVARERGDGMAA